MGPRKSRKLHPFRRCELGSRPVWGDVEDGIIGGDLTAGLAYLTPAGGAVVTPVAPIGLRDRDAAPVSFGGPEVFGAARPQAAPESQAPPGKGTGPRVDSKKAATRAGALDEALLAWRDGDGLPLVAPVGVGAPSADGIALSGPLPS